MYSILPSGLKQSNRKEIFLYKEMHSKQKQHHCFKILPAENWAKQHSMCQNVCHKLILINCTQKQQFDFMLQKAELQQWSSNGKCCSAFECKWTFTAVRIAVGTARKNVTTHTKYSNICTEHTHTSVLSSVLLHTHFSHSSHCFPQKLFPKQVLADFCSHRCFCLVLCCEYLIIVPIHYFLGLFFIFSPPFPPLLFTILSWISSWPP